MPRSLDTPLNPKQEALVREYVDGGMKSGRAAAVAVGYSEKYAAETASSVLRKHAARDLIESLLENKLERVGLSKDDHLRSLIELTRVNIATVARALGENDISELPREVANGIQKIKVRAETVRGVKTGEVIEVQLVDRLRLLEQIGRHVDVDAFASQKVDLNVEITASKQAERIRRGRDRLAAARKDTRRGELVDLELKDGRAEPA